MLITNNFVHFMQNHANVMWLLLKFIRMGQKFSAYSFLQQWIYMEEERPKLNVKDWIIISTTMIGVNLTILALIWQAKPTQGIYTVSLFLMLSFILFINSVSANSKANFEVQSGNASEKTIMRFVSFAEYSFGLGFTFIIVGFSILSYKYLQDFIGLDNIIVLIIPLAFLVTAWIMIFIYNAINYSGKPLKGIRSLKRNLWMIMEFICLVMIILDFFSVISIP